jgi:serine/threonine-protein kinase
MTDRASALADRAEVRAREGKRLTKKVFVSTADMGPQLARAGAPDEGDGQDTRDARAAKALGAELAGLARERPLSRTWRARWAADGPLVAVVVVAEGATAAEKELFARMAEDLHAAGDAVPGILRVRSVAPSRDAFLTDLWTTGSARDISALKWPPRRRVEFVLKMVRALDGLHALGLVHGCLCPANVLLDDDLEPVVAEAGSVPVHDLVERGGDAELYAAYAAPEVTSGGEVDARSDLYSVGRILDDVTKGDDSPSALKDIVTRCCSPDAGVRYASAAELATALEGVVGLLSDAEAAPPGLAAATAPLRPPVERERPARREPVAEPRVEKAGPSVAWRPRRILGVAGLAAVAAAVGASALFGGSSDGLRTLLTVCVVGGAALASTLLRPAVGSSLKKGSAMQLALAGGLAAVALIVDPLSFGYRLAAQRRLHGDDTAKHAAFAEIIRLGRDFRGLSLAGVDLSQANLTHARLFGAEVQGASFDGASLAGASLEQVQLELANVGSATCDGDTRLPHGWHCKDGHVTRSPTP